jgi:hypothetical protein
MMKRQIRETSRPIAKARSRRSRRKRTWLPGMEALEVRQVPTTFVVNTTLDTVAANLQTGKDSAGHISLRSAIQAANAHPGSDAIKLPNGTLTITIAGANEDNDATGDLDIKGDLTIDGSNSTTIDGNALDRVFEVLSGNVRISGVTIRNGSAFAGGGLLNLGGSVTLSNDTITNNNAPGANSVNGGPGQPGMIGGPGSSGLTGSGGGVANFSGSMTITNSVISSNLAIGGFGGTGGRGGDAEGVAATGPGLTGGPGTGGAGGFGGAGGRALGGGVFNADKLTLSNVTFASNQAIGGAGGAGGMRVKGHAQQSRCRVPQSIAMVIIHNIPGNRPRRCYWHGVQC